MAGQSFKEAEAEKLGGSEVENFLTSKYTGLIHKQGNGLKNANEFYCMKVRYTQGTSLTCVIFVCLCIT